MMRGASLRSVAELLGHQSMKMTMRYAHSSPAFLSAEVRLLDLPAASAELKLRPTECADSAEQRRPSARKRKGQEFVKEFGSPHWTISATGCSWAWRPAKRE